MLDKDTKKRIDDARDILVGKVPDPKSQVEQITIALIYKFMDDMDKESVEMGGKATFFTEGYEDLAWAKLLDKRLEGHEVFRLYSDALQKLPLHKGKNFPQLFRDIFKNAYLPYRDPETLKMFLKKINEFTYDHSEKLGDAFEYLLSVLGSQGDAGQFRTPRHIIDFIVEVLQPQKNETICDPACGTAGFLISSYKHILENNKNKQGAVTLTPDERKKIVKNFKGYDISPDMVRLSLVNMYLHNFSNPQIEEYDTLTSDDKWNETFDIIMANPPFMTPKGGIRPHKRFSIESNRSEVLFVDYIAEHINPATGRAGIIVPEGIIFQNAGAYKSLRKMLVENNYIYAVVSLPAGIFNPYSGVKTSILLMDKAVAKKTDKILFLKIDNEGFGLGAQRKEIDKNDLPVALEVLAAYKNAVLTNSLFENNSSLALLVDKANIAEDGDYNLAVDRYRVGDIANSKWEMVQLGNVCEVLNGRAFKQEELLEKGKYPVLRVGNFFSNRNWYYSDLVLEDNKYCDNGDLLFAWSASFGPRIWNDGKVIYHYHIWKLLPRYEKINKEYLYYILQKETEQIKEEGGRGIAMIHITKSGFEKKLIPLPPLPVQQKIVNKIDRYQKIIDGAKQVVENYKPEIEIDPEWEMVELGRVCENLDSKRRPVTSSDRKKGIYPYYGASGIVDYVDSYIFDGDYLLVSEDGANLVARVTPIAFSITGKNWVNNHAHILSFKEKASQKFVELYLNSISLNNYVTGSAQPKLNQANLNSIKIPFPNMNVQREIVTRIDNEKQLVSANKELIQIYEQKIKDEINKLWQGGEADDEETTTQKKKEVAAI